LHAATVQVYELPLVSETDPRRNDVAVKVAVVVVPPAVRFVKVTR